MLELPITPCKLRLAAVFGDNKNIRRKRRRAANAAEKIQRTRILRLGLIGRVQKNNVDWTRQLVEPLQHSADAAILQRKASHDLQCCEVLTDRCQRRLCVFGQPYMTRSTADRLDPHSPGAGIEIDKARPLDPQRDDIEEPLTQAVAGRASL